MTRVAALPLLTLLVFAGCSSDTDGLGDAGPVACSTNDDCPADQYCADMACADGTGNACESDGDCGEGEICDVVTDCGASRCSGNTCIAAPCEDEEDCDEGEVCVEGACVEPTGCEDDDECPEGQACFDEVCTPIEDLECEDDDECPEDFICVEGGCEEAVPCDDDTDCETGLVCIQEICRAPCQQDSDCGSALQWSCEAGVCTQRCLNSNMCPEGQFCRGNLCFDAECEADADCNPPMLICEGEEDGRGECVEVTPCGPNGECPTGSACDTATNRCEPLPQCRTDRDCDGDAFCADGFCVPAETCAMASCPNGFECVADVCVPAVCRSNADCGTGELCLGGACQVPPSADFVTAIRILTPAGVVRPGTTYRFVAIALDQAGRAVPGVALQWTSTATAVATIDGQGLATGGAVEGVTQIRARVTSSIGLVESSPVTLTNLGPAPMGDLRVRVNRQDTGAAIVGAQVVLEGAGQTGTSDALGQVIFAGAGGPAARTLTVAHPDFDWVTVVGVTGDDLRIELPPRSRADVAAGARGAVDLAQVSTQGAISLSLSGASLPAPLFGSDPSQLFGGEPFQVDVPMLGSIPIPAGNTVAVEFMGFPLTLKDEYYAQARPGITALWSLGGRLAFGAGGLDIADLQNILAALLPFYQRFEHTVDPAVQTVAVPTVADTNDIDGDGDTTELVPDWASLPNRTLTPDQAQTLRYQLSVDNLPFVSGGNANTLVVVAGVILPGAGFVPLGLDGQSDGGGSGIVPTFVSKMAPAHGGLEVGSYAVLVTAIRTDMSGAPGPGSARLFTADRFPTNVDLSDGWLDSPVDATYSAATRQATLPALPGADLYRIALVGPEGGWTVYAAPGAGATTVTIPSAPAMTMDRAAGAVVTVDAIDLEATVTPSDLFEAASGGAAAWDRATRGFARALP